MRQFRFTIASLIGVVLFTAVAFAALREATVLWDSIVFTVTGCVLVAAVLLAVHRVGPSRAYWLGFALVGGAYLGATLIPTVEHRLATRSGLVYLASKIPQNQALVLHGILNGPPNTPPTTVAPSRATTSLTFTTAPSGYAVASSSQGSFQFWNAQTGRLLVNVPGGTEAFVRIGHSFLALLAAIFGGQVSRWLYAGANRRDEGPARPDAREA